MKFAIGLILGFFVGQAWERAGHEGALAPLPEPRQHEILVWGESRGIAPAVLHATVEAAGANRADPWLVLAVIDVESSFRTCTVSHTGDSGLMQISAPLARRLRMTRADLCDPQKNINVGVAYLAAQLRRCGGDPVCALSAYNGDRSGAYARRVLARLASLRTQAAGSVSL